MVFMVFRFENLLNLITKIDIFLLMKNFIVNFAKKS
jgi:hypothetical protein